MKGAALPPDKLITLIAFRHTFARELVELGPWFGVANILGISTEIVRAHTVSGRYRGKLGLTIW